MEKNLGNIDRLVRLVIGLGLLSLTVLGPTTLWGLVGFIPVITALTGFCPAYRLFGIRTCAR